MSTKDTVIHQDCSTLSWYLRYWWNSLGGVLPNSLAPNVITFSGGFVMILSGVLAMVSQQPWTLLFHSLSIFIFQTLDALDGIQARRLGVSSKLGNYIDHATDIITIQIMFQILFQTLQLQGPLLIFATLFANYNLYLTHWETYQTNILYFPDGFSITELQWLCIILHLVTYAVPSIWSWGVVGLPLGDVLIMGILSTNACFLTLPLVNRVLDKKSATALWGLVPITAITLVLGYWAPHLRTSHLALIGVLNIPYTLITGSLLVYYLGLSQDQYPDSATTCYWLCLILLISAVYHALTGPAILLFACMTIFDYVQNVGRISQNLGVPIFSNPAR